MPLIFQLYFHHLIDQKILILLQYHRFEMFLYQELNYASFKYYKIIYIIEKPLPLQIDLKHLNPLHFYFVIIVTIIILLFSK